MDPKVAIALKNEKIKSRPKAEAGSFLVFLLPTAIICNPSVNKSSEYVFAINTILSLIYLFCNIYSKQSINISFRSKFKCCLVLCILSFYVFKISVRWCILYGVLSTYCYYESLLFILQSFPESFTFGEANIILQGVLIFFLSCLNHFSSVYHAVSLSPNQISTTIIQVGYLGLFIIASGSYFHKSFRTTIGFYIWTLSVCFLFIVPILQFLIKQNAIVWIVLFLVEDLRRIYVISLWAVCAISAVLFLSYQINTKEQATTSIRKYFHVLLTVVVTTGVMFDIQLVYLSCSIVLALLIYLEMLRVLKIEPMSEYLQEGFKVFADDKDIGNIALTPLYLLVGCSLPLWLYTDTSENSLLPMLSGVLSVGVGDTGASVIGSRFGRIKWPNSCKTVEGTLGCISSQILFVLLLCCFGYNYFELKVIVAIIITSLVEASTDQVDNLVLPLVSFIILIL